MSGEPLVHDPDIISVLFSSASIIVVSIILIGIGFFSIWFSELDMIARYGFSEVYAGLALPAIAFGIVGLLLGGGWFMVSLYFIAIAWIGTQIQKVIKISDDPNTIQVILHFATPVIIMIIVAWIGMHDPHSALCHGNPFGVTCERVITIQESMGVTP